MNSLPKHLQPDYLDLLEKTLLYSFWPEPVIGADGSFTGGFVNPANRENGETAWPSMAFTMVNRIRLRNIRDLIQDAVQSGVPGGFAECGVWRGGASIYARACLPPERPVWVCDSFQGFPADEPEAHWASYKLLVVSQAEVMGNFEKFGLTENVDFVAGFFANGIPRVGELCCLRIDSDSERNARDILTALWPKLSVGGYLICDDYLPGVKRTFEEYLGYSPKLEPIDHWAFWFKKEKP